MATEKPTLLQRVISLLPALVIGALLLLTAGIVLLSTKNTTAVVSHEEEYWSRCVDILDTITCDKFVYDPEDKNKKCDCYLEFHIPQDIIGDVTLYYELGFDQTRPEYANSRDNNQLIGNPGSTPSEACGNYSYTDDKKPIFPCGEVADTMFTDIIDAPVLHTTHGNSSTETEDETDNNVNITRSGILTEDMKMHYHNPPENATTGFAEPKSWHGRFWEDASNNAGTGVENEAFQAWMNTNLKRKPVWRLLPTNDSVKFPTGDYIIRIEIRYFAAMFNGTRKFIIEGVYPTVRTAHVVCGSIALVLGIPLSIATVVIIAKKQEKAPKTEYNAATLPVSDRLSYTPRNMDRISEESKLNKEVNGD